MSAGKGTLRFPNEAITAWGLCLVALTLGIAGCGETSTSKNEDAVLKAQQETPNPIAELQKRADAGDAKAQYELGRSYRDGKGVTKDAVKAAEWFLEAANQGYSEAQSAFAEMLLQGHVIEQNYAGAIEFFEKAAAQGDGGAYFNLGLIYQSGDGIPPDLAKSEAYFVKAFNIFLAESEKGDAGAQLTLGESPRLF